APFAAALAVQAVVPPGSPDTEKRYYNITWAVVLGIGLLIGLLNVKVIPVIILAQAANGFVLPIVSGFLLWAVNQPQYMGDRLNGRLGNALFVIVLTISLFLGFDNLLKALDGALDLSLRGNTTVTYIELGLAVVLSGVILWFATKNRRKVAD
ncbi:MAG TPA: hypothetical protein DCP28_10570, partial [Cytophagales bacterium]|nr:hypothetical protein [Cytophagales bacterium]